MANRNLTAPAAALILFASATAAGACGLALPHGWDPAKARWTGACSEGLAEGRGMVTYADAERTDVLYGAFEKGWIARGVVSTGRIYTAIRFEHGRYYAEDGPALRNESYREGARAAEDVASRALQAGDQRAALNHLEQARAIRGEIGRAH